jgi:rubrerythrin
MDQRAPDEPAAETPLTDDELVEALGGLAELDGEVAAAYAVASDALSNDEEIGHALAGFRDQHERHVRELNRLLARVGGATFHERADGRGLLPRLAETAAALGAAELLGAMLSNELLTNSTYRTALELPCGDEVRAVLAINLADEQRHLAWLTAARERLIPSAPGEASPMV